jgi:sugar lactone lactonase YvrE
MRTFIAPTVLAALSLIGCSAENQLAPESADLGAGSAAAFPEVIALPDGFWPEGIAFGRGPTFYVTSLATGAIFRGDARTGAGGLLVPAQPGREVVGLEYDTRNERLVVAGGFTGQAYIHDAATGATLAVYQLADPTEGLTLVNDVVLTSGAAYLTDSYRPVLYRIPLPPSGAIPAATDIQVLPISGDFEFDPATPIGNANGIAASPDERHLVVMNTANGKLYRVDARTGHATEVDLSGASLAGDGLLLVGQTLYVVEGPFNQITVIRLDPELAAGVVERILSDADLQFPSTIARFGNALYAVNARFDVTPGPDVQYQVVRLELGR